MKYQWKRVAGGVTAGLAALAIWALARDTPPASHPNGVGSRHPVESQSSEESASAETWRQARAEIAQLRAELRDVQEREPTLIKPEAPTSDAPAPSAARPAAPRKRKSAEQIGQRLEEALYSEGVDAQWARETEALVHSGLGRSLPNDSTLDAVDCRTSLCRVELTVPNAQSRDAIWKQLDEPPFDRQHFGRLDPETHSMVIFVARSGHALPTDSPSQHDG